MEILDFFAFCVRKPCQRCAYALAVVGGGWYERTFLVHFFCSKVVGKYLSQRMLSAKQEARSGLKVAWVDSDRFPVEYMQILEEGDVCFSADSPWRLQNNTNMIITCADPPDCGSLCIVKNNNCRVPPCVERDLQSDAFARKFYDYLINEHP